MATPHFVPVAVTLPPAIVSTPPLPYAPAPMAAPHFAVPPLPGACASIVPERIVSVPASVPDALPREAAPPLPLHTSVPEPSIVTVEPALTCRPAAAEAPVRLLVPVKVTRRVCPSASSAAPAVGAFVALLSVT